MVRETGRYVGGVRPASQRERGEGDAPEKKRHGSRSGKGGGRAPAFADVTLFGRGIDGIFGIGAGQWSLDGYTDGKVFGAFGLLGIC